MRKVLSGITGLLLLAGAAWGEVRDRIVVVQSDAGVLQVVDPERGVVESTIRVGGRPEHAALSPNGHIAIVSDRGVGQGDAKLLVVDLQQRRLLRSIPLEYRSAIGGDAAEPQLFTRPGDVCFPRGSRQALVACPVESVLLVLDVIEGRIVGLVPTAGKQPEVLLPSEDGKTLYVSYSGSGTVGVLDSRRRQTLATFETGTGARGLALREDASRLWVTNAGSNSISVIDLVQGGEVAEFATGAAPARLAVHADGRRLFCTNEDGGSVSVYDVHTLRIEREILLAPPRPPRAEELPIGERMDEESRAIRGCRPVELLFSPDHARLFVSCTQSESIAEIDTERGAVVRYIEVGAGPRDLLWWRSEDDRASAK